MTHLASTLASGPVVERLTGSALARILGRHGSDNTRKDVWRVRLTAEEAILAGRSTGIRGGDWA
jgi:hypothetical protein